MSEHRDVECMAHALRLARRGRFTTRPNPNVGCVIANKDGEVVGTGYHQKAGCAHAEIIALDQAGEQVHGGTAYVSLEPCCHEGKTGPCTQALIKAGVARVVMAMEDPNPLVSGKGMQQLKENGILVDVGVLAEQARALNAGYIKRMQTGLPWVTVKSAISVDGKTALHNGVSKWITSSAARTDVQLLRAQADVVLTGIGTVLADNPSLTVRLSQQELELDAEVLQPVRVVVDSRLQISTTAKMLTLPGKTIIFTKMKAQTEALEGLSNCEIVPLANSGDQIDMHDVLIELASREVNSILVEAGSTLVGNLIAQDLVDELVLYMAPKMFGSVAKGIADIGTLSKMDEHVSLEYKDVRHIGDDLKITALVKH